MRTLRHIDEQVDVVLVPLHVLVLNQPLDLFLDHFLGGQEHIFQDVDQLGVGDALPHLEDIDYGLLRPQDPQLDDALLSSLCVFSVTAGAAGSGSAFLIRFLSELKIT